MAEDMAITAAEAEFKHRWQGLYASEQKAWEGSWPEEHKAQYLQFLSAVRELVRKEPRLLSCPDFAARLIECAGMGLLPHWGPRGEAIITYNAGKNGVSAALIVGYKGYLTVWQRDGLVKPGGVIANARMPKDKWVYEEREDGTRFRWTPDYGSPRKYEGSILVFCRAILREGGCVVGIRDKAKCDLALNASKSPAAKAWPLEMAIKGAIFEAKRAMPNGQNTERVLEYEYEHEKDMGEAERVDMAKVRPLEIPAQTRVHEVITAPEKEPEKVTVERAVDRPPGQRIVDETEPTRPTDNTPEPSKVTWTDEHAAKLAEWEQAEGGVPLSVARELTDAARTVVGDARKPLAKRILAIQARVAKEREPGEEG